MKNPNCEECLGVVGVCTDCDGCQFRHCDCPECQHGKLRSEDCIFCGRGYRPLIDVMVAEDLIQQDMDWLFGVSESDEQSKGI